MKSLARGAICAAAIRPPAATMTNITYISQNTGVRTISPGVRLTLDCGRLRRLRPTAMSDFGLRRNSDASRTHTPWPMPKVRNACW